MACSDFFYGRAQPHATVNPHDRLRMLNILDAILPPAMTLAAAESALTSVAELAAHKMWSDKLKGENGYKVAERFGEGLEPHALATGSLGSALRPAMKMAHEAGRASDSAKKRGKGSGAAGGDAHGRGSAGHGAAGYGAGRGAPPRK